MKLSEFISENRAELESAINGTLNHVPASASCYCPKSRTEHDHNDGRRLSNEDLRGWILNDEGLYNWARRSGVRI